MIKAAFQLNESRYLCLFFLAAWVSSGFCSDNMSHEKELVAGLRALRSDLANINIYVSAPQNKAVKSHENRAFFEKLRGRSFLRIVVDGMPGKKHLGDVSVVYVETKSAKILGVYRAK